MKTVEVVAALIRQGEKFLIFRRPENKGCGLLWEFVGGKVEPGETLSQALVRECREELDMEITVGAPYIDVTHRYPDATVHLTLLEAQIKSGIPKLKEHVGMAYITVHQIPEFEFCPADRDILEKLIEDAKAREAALFAIKTGRYRHFKGNEYRLLGVARHSETLEPTVVYQALYGEGGIWVRPASMWSELVTKDGKTFPRFTYIGE